MSRIANVILAFAKLMSNLFGSKLAIRVQDNKIQTRFVTPEDTEQRLWKDYYTNAAIYIGNSVEPVDLRKEAEDIEIKSANYLKTFMQMNAIERAFSAKNAANTRMEYLMYGCIAAVGVVGLLVIVL